MSKKISSEQVRLLYIGNSTDIFVDDVSVATSVGRLGMEEACEILTDMDYSVSMAKYNVCAMKPEESLYVYRNSQQISMQTGFIGKYHADLKENGTGFQMQWDGYRKDLNTPEFNAEMIDVLHFISENGRFFSDRSSLSEFCMSGDSLPLKNGTDFGVRVDSHNYTYLMRLSMKDGNHDLCCYCYRRNWLDDHIEKARHGIRFVDAYYKEQFRLADGDKIIIKPLHEDPDALDSSIRYVCRYIDDYHLQYGDDIRHICEFAELLDRTGNTVIPLRNSLPERCYFYIQSENKLGVIEKGESGYIELPIIFKSSQEARGFADINNRKAGVTKAQAAAMQCGSLFGWHTPAADPKNYDENGIPIKPRSRVRESAR